MANELIASADDDAERRRIDNAYAEGYGRVPLTEDELAEVTRLTIESINEEPWEKWW